MATRWNPIATFMDFYFIAVKEWYDYCMNGLEGLIGCWNESRRTLDKNRYTTDESLTAFLEGYEKAKKEIRDSSNSSGSVYVPANAGPGGGSAMDPSTYIF